MNEDDSQSLDLRRMNSSGKIDVKKLSTNVRDLLSKKHQKSAFISEIVEEEDILFDQQIQFEEKVEGEAQLNEDQNVQKKKCSTIVQHSSRFRVRWDLSVIILVIYNCLQIPFVLAFKPDSDSAADITVGYLIDVVFLCDIFLNFRTTYINPKNGLEVFDGKRIALNYIFHWRFFTDVISIIPFEAFYTLATKSKKSEFKIFDLLKMIRLLRLSRIITYLKMKQTVQIGFRISQLIFMFLLIAHWVACMEYMVIQNNNWIPPKDQEDGTTTFYTDGMLNQYILVFYYAILNLVSNECSPVGPLHIMFTSMVSIFGQIIGAFIFGNMAVLMSTVNKKDSIFQEQYDRIIALMKSINLAEQTQTEVEQYIIHQQTVPHVQKDLEKLFLFISPPLKRQILFHLYKKVIKNIPTLKNLDNLEIRYIVARLNTELFMPDDVILRQYEKGKRVFFISSGIVEVYITPDCQSSEKSEGMSSLVKFLLNQESKSFPPKMIRQLKEGDYFGEVALISKLNRTSTIKAVDFCTIAYLDKKAFTTTRQDFPQFYDSLKLKVIETYNDENFRFRRKMIKNVPYFKELPDHIIQEILYLLRPSRYEAESLIVKKDQSSDCIFFLKNGTVDIELPLKNEEVLYVDSLNSGSCFSIYDAFHEDMKQKFDYRCKSICEVEVIRAKDMRVLELVHAELCDVLKVLRTQLEGIAKSTITDSTGANSLNPKSNSYVNLLGQSMLAKNSFFKSPSDPNAKLEEGKQVDATFNNQPNLKTKSVDFDYYRYTAFSKGMTAEKEIALSYVRKRFKLLLAKFYHRLKSSTISLGLTDKEQVQGKVGMQLLNFLKQQSGISVNQENKQQDKNALPLNQVFKLKLKEVDISKQGSEQLDVPDTISAKSVIIQKQISVIDYQNHSPYIKLNENLNKSVINGPNLEEERKIDRQKGDVSSIVESSDDQSKNHLRFKSTQMVDNPIAKFNFQESIAKLQKSRTQNLQNDAPKSEIDLESLIQLSLHKKMLSNNPISAKIQKALAEVDKNTDDNLIQSLKYVNQTILKQQEAMTTLQVMFTKRLKQMRKKMDYALKMGQPRDVLRQSKYRHYKYSKKYRQNIELKQQNEEDDEAVIIDTSPNVMGDMEELKEQSFCDDRLNTNPNFGSRPPKKNPNLENIVIKKNLNILKRQGTNSSSKKPKLQGKQFEEDYTNEINIIEEYRPDDGTPEITIYEEEQKIPFQQHSFVQNRSVINHEVLDSVRSVETFKNVSKIGPSMTSQIRQEFDELTDIEDDRNLGPQFKVEKLRNREFYSQETANDRGQTSQELTELEWGDTILQTVNPSESRPRQLRKQSPNQKFRQIISSNQQPLALPSRPPKIKNLGQAQDTGQERQRVVEFDVDLEAKGLTERSSLRKDQSSKPHITFGAKSSESIEENNRNLKKEVIQQPEHCNSEAVKEHRRSKSSALSSHSRASNQQRESNSRHFSSGGNQQMQGRPNFQQYQNRLQVQAPNMQGQNLSVQNYINEIHTQINVYYDGKERDPSKPEQVIWNMTFDNDQLIAQLLQNRIIEHQQSNSLAQSLHHVNSDSQIAPTQKESKQDTIKKKNT